MASAPNAEKTGMLKVIEYDTTITTQLQIREMLANNIAVLLVGWEPELQPELDVMDISYYRNPLDQTVSWQGWFRTASQCLLDD